MRVLIFGAGSIGQLYGHILQRGGATVDVYIRPKYIDDAQRGYRIYDRRRGLSNPAIFAPSDIHTTPDELEAYSYDLILLCVPSTALRAGWLDEFAPATGSAAIVSLTPGLEDEEILLQHFEEHRLGLGMITAVAYPAPLPGETAQEPGTAYWLPPMAPALFQGPPQTIEPLCNTLAQGGMKTKIVDNVSEQSRMGSAVLIPLVGILETVDWSFRKLRRSRSKRRFAAEAAEEALTLMEKAFDSKRPLPMRFLGPTTMKGALMMAPVVPPFDLERYLEVHFTKVGDQTRLFLDTYIRRREELGLESPALTRLLSELTAE